MSEVAAPPQPDAPTSELPETVISQPPPPSEGGEAWGSFYTHSTGGGPGPAPQTKPAKKAKKPKKPRRARKAKASEGSSETKPAGDRRSPLSRPMSGGRRREDKPRKERKQGKRASFSLKRRGAPEEETPQTPTPEAQTPAPEVQQPAQYEAPQSVVPEVQHPAPYEAPQPAALEDPQPAPAPVDLEPAPLPVVAAPAPDQTDADSDLPPVAAPAGKRRYAEPHVIVGVVGGTIIALAALLIALLYMIGTAA